MIDELASELRGAVGALGAQLRLLFASGGDSSLGFVALATLRHLRRKGPRTVTSLAESDRVTTQAISVRLKPLEEAGYIERTPDPQDGRRALVSSTASGIEVLDGAERRVDAALVAALSRLGDRERATLADAAPILAAIAAELGEAIHE